MFWFAQKNQNLSQLWVEKKYLERDDYSCFANDRLLPAIMVWGKAIPIELVSEPKLKTWKGQGDNPVAMMRTSWTDSNAIYVGFKAGSPSVNHGHMDVGSFIMEADGVRWASDFGMQEYESLESKGMSIFGRTQDAQRWSVFRLNNYSHNTLIVDNQFQQVKGFAMIDQFSDHPSFMYAISDISSVYENQLASAKRGIAVVDEKYVVVCDELTAPDKPVTIRWNMLTSAAPKLAKNGIVLTKNGKTLNLKVRTKGNLKMRTWSTTPTTTYDAPNQGTTLVGFELQLKPNQKLAVEVMLIPGSVDSKKVKFDKALANW
jgi:hypothetical protein